MAIILAFYTSYYPNVQQGGVGCEVFHMDMRNSYSSNPYPEKKFLNKWQRIKHQVLQNPSCHPQNQQDVGKYPGNSYPLM